MFHVLFSLLFSKYMIMPVQTICGPILVAVCIFGRWRANPGGRIRQWFGFGVDWCSYLGDLATGRVDLYHLWWSGSDSD